MEYQSVFEVFLKYVSAFYLLKRYINESARNDPDPRLSLPKGDHYETVT